MSARLFADLLREINRGEAHQDLSVKLNELVEAVATTNKMGTLTMKLTVKPESIEGAVGVKCDVTVKKPIPDSKPALFFVTDEFNLSRRDPRQGDIEDHLTVVEQKEKVND